MPSADEAEDLVVLNAAIQTKQLACFVYLTVLDDASADELMMMGQHDRTNAEAIQAGLRSYRSEIRRLVDQHVRKYPD